MKDLLKEAIADAKAVRETALANAKLALEEAFTPRLQSMISAKLAEEMSDDEEMDENEDKYMDNETPEGDNAMAGKYVDEGEDTESHEEEMPAEEPAEEMHSDESDMSDETEDDSDDLDLDEIIKELEASEAGDDEHKMEEQDELDDSGLGDDIEMPEDIYEDEDTSMDEDVDINEIIKALKEEDDMEEPKEDEELKEAKADLTEAYNVIRFMKGKLNEVNLLNAKLLYSNKLFRNFSLTEGQKMKVIENFDRAHNLREVKLVFSTLAESFKIPAKKVVKESFASKPVASTAPSKQVINEGSELANRFKKLAGLI
jgi:hypothetical protein